MRSRTPVPPEARMPTTAPSFAGRIEPPLPPRNHVARPRLREALDAFHAVDPGAEETADAVRLVDLLLERAPPNLFVLIGSRTLPALRHADFASAGRLDGVAAEELRFTPAEVAEWLGVEPSDRRA